MVSRKPVPANKKGMKMPKTIARKPKPKGPQVGGTDKSGFVW
jgi:hypothetical protein